jgi:hypothetical protein
MVRTMNKVLADNTIVGRPPRIVEIVGPAGTGKTELSRVLGRRSKRIVIGAPPDVRSVVALPFFIRNGLLLMPTILRLYQNNSRWPTRREIAWMIELRGWHRVLGQGVSNEGAVIVLDQGPVFLLSWLYEFGPESLKSQRSEKWWDSMIKQWAATLDMVIWLDAPNTVLVERINARNKAHRVKGRSEQETYRFLARWRTSFEQIVAKLTANCGLRVLRFDTEQESLDQIVDKVLATFGLEPTKN